MQCNPAPETCKTLACRNDVDQQTYPMPFYIFVILSILFPMNVAFTYSLWMRCYGEIRSSNQPLSEDQTQNKETYRGSYCYFFHLVIRFLFGILFTVLQHTVFFPSGFEPEFSCYSSLPPRNCTSKIAKNASGCQSNVHTFCLNRVAHEKELYSLVTSILNTLVSFVMLAEIIYLCRRSSKFNRAAVDCLSRFIYPDCTSDKRLLNCMLCFLFYLVIGSLLYLLIHLKTLIT